MSRREIVARLLRSREPSIQWNTRARILNEDLDSRAMLRLRERVRSAPRTRSLLREPVRPGRSTGWGVYAKWRGAHWALASLAELGYPPGDRSLAPTAERVADHWLRSWYWAEHTPIPGSNSFPPARGVPRIEGRYRRCASQQGNALLACTRLGLAPEQCDRLAARLLHWQWPDGGWNCDTDPSADTSSFEESVTPLVALATYGRTNRVPEVRAAALRASEVFLRRRLYRRVSDGRVMHAQYLQFHFPRYYHYDLLGGLRAMSCVGRMEDPRCADALDWVESRELPSGGWAADARWFDLPGEPPRKGRDRVDWGPTPPRWNEWVTVEALSVLRDAGRFAFDG